MATSEISKADFKRIVYNRYYKPGDWLQVTFGDNKGFIGRFENQENLWVTLNLNGTVLRVMPGHLARFHDDNEIELARQNLIKAGYKWEAGDGTIYWHRKGEGQYGGSELRPPAGLVDSYGHNQPPCTECELPVKRFEGCMCFNCRFWTEKLTLKGIRVDNEHYMHSDDSGAFKGHGGHLFTIQMDSGEILMSSNLWYQGVIPEHFRDKLPDNARFL